MRLSLALSLFACPCGSLAFAPLVVTAPTTSFSRQPTTRLWNAEDPFERDDFPSDGEVVADEVDAEVVINIAPEAIRLKEDLLSLASATKRGFDCSREQRQMASDIIYDLASYNPTKDPASPYYSSSDSSSSSSSPNTGEPTLAGKWTLVYTDAPDITTLDGGPLAGAKLGRIGQECAPPFIKNVIEWRRPDWAASLPFSGTEESRVLQKVCIEAKASPEKPFMVDLQLVGLDLLGMGGGSSSGSDSSNNLQDNIKQDGITAGFFKSNPVELRGPLSAPFGQFEILYLDNEMRIIKTGQNFLAVNVRDEVEWF